MIYRAAAAYPYQDREHAAAGLRGQLLLMALAGGGDPNWATFVVEGPTEAAGIREPAWFEWTGSVEVHGGRDLTRDVADEAVPLPRPGAPAWPSEATQPQPLLD